ncbi:hypothetical protein [Flavobacterium cellulosilyticum]|uniref:Uncharacterized protein n=1 Tax=Flavobacterium cellulosilyticum TaxID=2541731 RepID=A0A4R5CF50_9FLAO|nr:hypothetical protein [Flavobacterium cellulosilyticum]TDD98728.1 hypothetical protein E0F76_06265 [Flavobacterium cellulosilyticum]
MNKFLGIIALAFFTFSCSSELDFNQINNIETKPVIVANLASFDIQANQFVKGGIEQIQTGDLINFEVFNDSFFKTNLKRVDFYFEFNNTINRAYTINLYFLDDKNSIVYSIPFDVPAYSGVQNVVTKTEVFQGANLDLLKKTAKIAFTVTMHPGPLLNENSLGNLKLRSSATIYLNAE